jgi:hypothetical protein
VADWKAGHKRECKQQSDAEGESTEGSSSSSAAQGSSSSPEESGVLGGCSSAESILINLRPPKMKGEQVSRVVSIAL